MKPKQELLELLKGKTKFIKNYCKKHKIKLIDLKMKRITNDNGYLGIPQLIKE